MEEYEENMTFDSSFVDYIVLRTSSMQETEEDEERGAYNYDAKRDQGLKRYREEELESQLDRPSLDIDREGLKAYTRELGFAGDRLVIYNHGRGKDEYAYAFNRYVRDLSYHQKLAVTALQGAHPDFVDFNLNPALEKELIERFNFKHDTLRIGPSKYGRGLFATKFIPKGTFLGKYPGVKIPRAMAHDLPDQYDKMVDVNANEVVIGDVQNHKNFSPLPYMNDPGYEQKEQIGKTPEYWPPSSRESVEHVLEDDRVAFYTKKDIKAGEEIYWFYGHPYWQDSPTYYPNQTIKGYAGREARRYENKK